MAHDADGCWDPCPATHVRHFGAMDIEFERRDEIVVRVHVHLATLLVDVAILSPDQLEWGFEAEAGGAAARGKLRLDLGAPRFYTTIHGELDYTASGGWQTYHGLLWHWEATGLPPGRPMWVEAFTIDPRDEHDRRRLRDGAVDPAREQRTAERHASSSRHEGD